MSNDINDLRHKFNIAPSPSEGLTLYALTYTALTLPKSPKRKGGKPPKPRNYHVSPTPIFGKNFGFFHNPNNRNGLQQIFFPWLFRPKRYNWLWTATHWNYNIWNFWNYKHLSMGITLVEYCYLLAILFNAWYVIVSLEYRHITRIKIEGIIILLTWNLDVSLVIIMYIGVPMMYLVNLL